MHSQHCYHGCGLYELSIKQVATESWMDKISRHPAKPVEVCSACRLTIYKMMIASFSLEVMRGYTANTVHISDSNSAEEPT